MIDITDRQLAAQVWGTTGPADERSRDELASRHRLQSRADLAHIHPSWLVRALQEEPASVRSTVARAWPEPAAVLESAFPGLAEVQPTRPVASAAAACVLSLWTERLVGDVPSRPGDPPILTRLTTAPVDDGRQNRFLVGLGLAKLAYLDEPSLASEGLPARIGMTIERLARTWKGPRSDDLRRQARADLAARGEAVGAAGLARLGLLSVSRLLTGLDPFRLRWTLQHLPYRSARAIRAHLADGQDVENLASLAAWEQRLFDHAERHRLLPNLPGEGPDS